MCRRFNSAPSHHFKTPKKALFYELIVPVAIDGFFEAWPRGKNFQGFTHLQIEVLDPIYPDPNEPAEKSYERLTTELRTQIVAAWERMHAEKHPKSV